MAAEFKSDVLKLQERRAVAINAVVFASRQAGRKVLSASDASVAFQIADLLSHVAGSELAPLDPALLDGKLPDAAVINTAVDKAMRKTEGGTATVRSPEEDPTGVNA